MNEEDWNPRFFKDRPVLIEIFQIMPLKVLTLWVPTRQGIWLFFWSWITGLLTYERHVSWCEGHKSPKNKNKWLLLRNNILSYLHIEDLRVSPNFFLFFHKVGFRKIITKISHCKIHKSELLLGGWVDGRVRACP